MDEELRPREVLNAALSRMMRPLFKLLLRYGISYGSFEDLARRTFVNVAITEGGLNGKKASVSRIAILSGLTRKEVQRLLALTGEAPLVDRHNRAARVLTGWVRDPDFHDSRGQPRILDPDGDEGFSELVRRHSGDVPVRAILDELIRVGAVSQRDGGGIELLARAYVPSRSAVEKLRILGTDVADLIDTIDHNIVSGAHDSRYQRKVVYRSMPASAVLPFRTLSAKQSQALLEKLDRWLAKHDLDNPPDQPDLPRARIGLGIYYFEDVAAPPASRNEGDLL